MQEILYDIRVYSIPAVTIVEIMGRDAGWLTAASCLVRANGETAPHLIYLPESSFSPERYLEDVKKAVEKHKAVLVCVSEGIHFPGGTYDTKTDAFGHIQNAGIGRMLENYTKENLKCKVRSIELNLPQRCASHTASLTDLKEAKLAGEAAVLACTKENKSGIMITFNRVSNAPYKIETSDVPVEKVANKERKFPVEWITKEGNDVTNNALNFFLPLIQGEPKLEYKNGIPVYFKI